MGVHLKHFSLNHHKLCLSVLNKPGVTESIKWSTVVVSYQWRVCAI